MVVFCSCSGASRRVAADLKSQNHESLLDISAFFFFFYVAVDCVLGEWGPWGECDSHCGIGQKSRTREILTPPQNGGKVCGMLEDSVECFLEPCGKPDIVNSKS